MRDERPLVVLGARAHAREVLDAILQLRPGRRVEAVVVDREYLPDAPVDGVPGRDFDWLRQNAGRVVCVTAVGSSWVRQSLVNKAESAGAQFVDSLVAPGAVVSPRAQLGVGAVVLGGAVVGNGASIGRHAHLNLGAIVPHNCEIGDFGTVAPGAALGGYVAVGDGAFVGLGARVLEYRRVGARAIVGAGAVVIEDVPEGATVVGVPARVIRTGGRGWSPPDPPARLP